MFRLISGAFSDKGTRHILKAIASLCNDHWSAVGYEETTSHPTGHGESTPSSGRKFLVSDTEQVDPDRTICVPSLQ